MHLIRKYGVTTLYREYWFIRYYYIFIYSNVKIIFFNCIKKEKKEMYDCCELEMC